MKRFYTYFLTIAVFAVFSVGLVGCDETPSNVEDFPVQGTMDSPLGLTVSSDASPEFQIAYQGLEDRPNAEILSSASDFQLEKVNETGSAEEGSTTWRLSLATNQIQEVIKTAQMVISGDDLSSSRTITDTTTIVATTKLSVSTGFTSNYITFADYDGDIDVSSYEEAATGQDPDTLLANTDPYEGGGRTITTSGANVDVFNADPPGFSIPSNSDNLPAGSNGVRYLDVVNTSQGGSVTIRRRMNLPDSDTFFLLVEPADQPLNMTLTFTEVTDGTDGSGENPGTTTHEFEFPLTPGTGWLKLGIPFSEISDSFNPVAPRSGGNGPLLSVTLQADGAAAYAVDEMLFGKDGLPRAELHDFETTTNAYGPPFCGGQWGFTDDVPAGSDGFSARTVVGGACMGYNFGGGLGPPAMVFVDVDGNDILSFYGKGVGGDRGVYAFIEAANGAGEYTGGNGQSVTLPEGTWKKVEIPLSDLGSDPSALLDPGIRNVGLGGCANCVIDDLKIVPKE